MKWYGSVTNRIEENGLSPLPEVGMGATIYRYSDRTACTVIEVVSPTVIKVQHDTATRTDTNGQSEAQEYAYTPNPKGKIETLRKGKRGWRTSPGASEGARLNVRDAYYDFSF